MKNPLKLSRPQGQIIDLNAKNRNRSAILIFEHDTYNFFQVIAPTRSNY